MTREHFTPKPNHTYADDVSPDSLMSDFRGRPIVAILVFTLVVHVILVGVFSVGYLKNRFLGEDTSAMSKEQRLDVAVREATTSLREIAERHGLSPQELSSRFAAGGVPPVSTTGPPPEAGTVEDTPPVSDPASAEPDSAIEKTLQEKAVGPDLPDLAPEEEDDLF